MKTTQLDILVPLYRPECDTYLQQKVNFSKPTGHGPSVDTYFGSAITEYDNRKEIVDVAIKFANLSKKISKKLGKNIVLFESMQHWLCSWVFSGYATQFIKGVHKPYESWSEEYRQMFIRSVNEILSPWFRRQKYFVYFYSF